jgi:poly(3-hydroxybutyrate) depolymerase
LTAALVSQSYADELPALKADLSQTSVSGLSSGGYMAGQFHVAYSKTVIGAAIVAAGPFGCAESAGAEAFPYFPTALALNLAQAENGCTANNLSAFGVLDSDRLLKIASSLADEGKIDPLSNLQRSKVYLYSGEYDRTVAAAVVKAARDFYLAAGVPSSNIEFVSNKLGGHAFSTVNQGGSCERSDPPYVNNCNYDQAGDILHFIYGPLESRGSAQPDDFRPFSQGAYASSDASLADEGIVYVPQACRSQGHCRVHIVFHGCKQSRAEVGDALIRESGFADWAAANRMIVLFPQAAPSSLNPSSCWDWWGYTGLDFLSKDAPQMKAIAGMLAALAK